MLPAFGRELLELRREGKRPAQLVYVVCAWPLAHELRRRDRFALMVELPRDELGSPRMRRFDFSMLQDLEVVIIPEWFDWLGIVEPQVRAVRPRALYRIPSFIAERESVEQKVTQAMERECQRAAA